MAEFDYEVVNGRKIRVRPQEVVSEIDENGYSGKTSGRQKISFWGLCDRQRCKTLCNTGKTGYPLYLAAWTYQTPPDRLSESVGICKRPVSDTGFWRYDEFCGD